MVINTTPVYSQVQNVQAVKKVQAQKNANNNSLFAYMNAGLSLPKDGTAIAYMNASNKPSSGSSSGSSGGSTVCIA